MYISDQTADAIVATDAKSQAVVRGDIVTPPTPGRWSGVSVNTCLMFGWMGTTVSVYRMLPALEHMMHWYTLCILIVMGAMEVSWRMVLYGRRSARSGMYAYALFALAAAGVVVAAALFRSDWVAAGLAAPGFALMFTAQRLVASRSYAVFAAFFRARRLNPGSALSARAQTVAPRARGGRRAG